MKLVHQPVLLKEVLDGLNLHPGDTVIDGTVGIGGHAAAVWQRIAPDGRLLAIDRDEQNLKLARERLSPFGGRIAFAQGSYADVKKLAYEHAISSARGILLDLGYASSHVEDPARGFSFQNEGPLDMRYDVSQELTADTLVNLGTQDELADIFRRYGEERQARKIAQAIYTARRKEQFKTTTQLADFIAGLMPRRGRIHPATKIFQALRIVVNDELGELERALPELVDMLEGGGRLAVISFHSLEDRLVKQFIKKQAETGAGENLTKRVITPSKEEVRSNPRARSAKIRIFEKYDGNSAHNQTPSGRHGDG
ncbi:TPA: 16S rRNA (cytosine(1402)-N(4))-methyltransferase [Candidatus Uhrbacteria bacterium]|nr:MAG: Ribosomal RNA small subunit methyltransferase H [Parcubacteria group bacterium GW2011_GWA2_53_21]HBL39851.1 16S rRNA (cytosine(1402)-N(4))-methyltransferase [Candidatus Uhrbacteria bacterium]